ncbi:hypothetical protein ADUPG1_013447 [Aduncisulcus paluster]|uniref:Uncharacterized protein n=1 Tax=Aduncisulcus paluster TaxID=2918883 RepID=A0ABQ5K2Z8_9EUKA|nr:hypothetical protein ADUPG1_013447 [Aduncisulcus paluster]|eukprot:gnl/Carplike_NY0171/634_a869_2011.p1 GENE.gnl/Carplike_NY0171/634_a869_2011~~gnl/Carplike_NY0171/634_a869_2011.p1  ORF type:complete len:229 (+),score=34.71 gnl/Carplike_NY0171/634_a869_2011:23-709(+)
MSSTITADERRKRLLAKSRERMAMAQGMDVIEAIQNSPSESESMKETSSPSGINAVSLARDIHPHLDDESPGNIDLPSILNGIFSSISPKIDSFSKNKTTPPSKYISYISILHVIFSCLFAVLIGIHDSSLLSSIIEQNPTVVSIFFHRIFNRFGCWRVYFTIEALFLGMKYLAGFRIQIKLLFKILQSFIDRIAVFIVIYAIFFFGSGCIDEMYFHTTSESSLIVEA